jgi:outer membrane immunogenic protein
MKTRLLGAVLATAAGLSTTAIAADVYSAGSVKDVPVSVPVTNWTGFYVGLQAGAASNASSLKCENGPCDPISYDTSLNSVLAGGYVGYNAQYGRFVLGVEFDMNASLGKNNFSSGSWEAVEDGYKISQSYYGSVRGRAGYLLTEALLGYVTGGWAFADYKFDNPSCPNCADWGNLTLIDGNRDGFVIGGGLEYALSQNVHFKGEYLYSGFGTQTKVYDGVSFPSKLQENQVRIGISYNFGGCCSYAPLK